EQMKKIIPILFILLLSNLVLAQQLQAQFQNGDVNCDGKLDVEDALMVARFDLGLRTFSTTCTGNVGVYDPAKINEELMNQFKLGNQSGYQYGLAAGKGSVDLVGEYEKGKIDGITLVTVDPTKYQLYTADYVQANPSSFQLFTQNDLTASKQGLYTLDYFKQNAASLGYLTTADKEAAVKAATTGLYTLDYFKQNAANMGYLTIADKDAAVKAATAGLYSLTYFQQNHQSLGYYTTAEVKASPSTFGLLTTDRYQEGYSAGQTAATTTYKNQLDAANAQLAQKNTQIATMTTQLNNLQISYSNLQTTISTQPAVTTISTQPQFSTFGYAGYQELPPEQQPVENQTGFWGSVKDFLMWR
ncbi:MAG: hypothetical protein ABIA37_03015, partial [Candidatus Woesearchaeota archaeon]